MAAAVRKASLLMGHCVPCMKVNASKILVRKLELDTNLLWYFKKEENYFAYDPKKICKVGDIVLIRELPLKMTKLITHKVEEILFKCGDVIDPMTGKPVVAFQYRDDIENIIEQYGRVPSAFDYKSAPPRGRLEGTRDFSDKGTYTKYHDDGKNDPYAV